MSTDSNSNKFEPIPKEVIQRFAAKKGNSWTAAFFYMMKELGVSHDAFEEMPVSRLNVLLLELRDHNAREEKELKKSQRKK